MRKSVIAGIVSFILCAAVLIAILNINAIIDRNRTYLLARAQEALGRKISAGDIELTLWSGVGLRVKDVTIADDPRFSAGDFVRARDAQVHLKLLPLFRREFEVKNVLLHDPVITVIKSPAGVFNFASLGKREDKEKPEKKQRGGKKREGSGDLRIALADISNGELTYRDQKERVQVTLKQIDLTVKDGGLETPVSVRLEGAAFGDKRNLKLETRIGPIQGGDWRHVPVDGEISFDPLDLTQLQAAVPSIRGALPKEFSAAGLLAVKHLKLKGTADNLGFNGTVNGTSAAVAFGTAFRKAPGVAFEIAADGQYANPTLHIRKADIKLYRTEATAKGEINFGVPAVSLSINSKPSSVKGLDQIFPVLEGYQLSGNVEAHTTLRGKIGKGTEPDIQGNLTLAGVSATPPQFSQPVKDLNGKVSFTGRRASVREGSVTVGVAKIRWSGIIESFSPLRFSYNLSTPELRPADFQSAPAEARRADVLKNVTSQGSVNMQGGRLALQAKVDSSDGGLFEIPYQRLETSVAVADNVVNVRGLRVNALRGALLADGEYAMSEVPRFTVTSKIQGVDLNEGYRAFSAQAPRDIQGRLNANLKLAGSGRSWEEIKPNLRGQGEAQVVDGALRDFNLVDAALSGATGIPGMKNFISPQVRKKYPETFEAKDTKFKQLKARLDLADGRIDVKDLQLVAADYSIRGDGWVDFDRRVEFRSSLMLSPGLSADLAHSAREIKFLFNEQNEFQMPFTVSGTLPNVKTRPDASYLAKALQRGFLGQGVEQLERRLFGKKDSPPGKKDDQPPDETQNRKRRDTEDLIRRGLENLFRRN